MAETRARGTCRCKGFDDRVFWDSCGTCQRRRAEAAEARAAALEAERRADDEWMAAAMKAIEGLTAGAASFTGHPVVDCVAELRALALRRGEALRRVLAIPWIAEEFDYLDKGIGTATDAGKVLLEARALRESEGGGDR
jgi:hypothetical protein